MITHPSPHTLIPLTPPSNTVIHHIPSHTVIPHIPPQSPNTLILHTPPHTHTQHNSTSHPQSFPTLLHTNFPHLHTHSFPKLPSKPPKQSFPTPPTLIPQIPQHPHTYSFPTPLYTLLLLSAQNRIEKP